MTVHSGRFGTIDGIPAVRNWQINDDASLSAFANSATRRAQGRRKGVSQWGGSYGAHGAVPIVLPGELFDFLGYTAPDTDVEGTAGITYSGNAIVDSFGVAWDWAGGSVLAHQIGFSGNLALTKTPADAAVLDASVSDPEYPCPTKITYSVDGITFTELTDLVQASFNIQAQNSAYVNSSTGCNTGRKAGLIDWNLSMTTENNNLGGGLTKFTDYWFRLYITATTYYELKFGMVKSFSGLTIDEESGRIISHTINVEANAVKAGGSVGHILLPDTTLWWGDA